MTKNNRAKWYNRFGDCEFVRHYDSGEALGVYVVRDLAEEVNTGDKWIDILSMERSSDISRVIAEMFPRITNPKYTDDKEVNKYLCWRAAHEDVATYRSKCYKGEKYIVYYKRTMGDEGQHYTVIKSEKVNDRQIE